MVEALDGNTWVPPALAAGSATAAAVMLCRWLEALRTVRVEDFRWLVEKWTTASERERGRMVLVDDAEVELAHRLSDSAHVQLQISHSKVAQRNQDGDTKPVTRMRIKCMDAHGQAITRDTLAVRWVMTYVAAKWANCRYST